MCVDLGGKRELHVFHREISTCRCYMYIYMIISLAFIRCLPTLFVYTHFIFHCLFYGMFVWINTNAKFLIFKKKIPILYLSTCGYVNSDLHGDSWHSIPFIYHKRKFWAIIYKIIIRVSRYTSQPDKYHAKSPVKNSSSIKKKLVIWVPKRVFSPRQTPARLFVATKLKFLRLNRASRSATHKKFKRLTSRVLLLLLSFSLQYKLGLARVPSIDSAMLNLGVKKCALGVHTVWDEKRIMMMMTIWWWIKSGLHIVSY